MGLTTIHKVLIFSAVCFFGLIAAKMGWLVATRSTDFLPMTLFNGAAALGLAIYLVRFHLKTRQGYLQGDAAGVNESKDGDAGGKGSPVALGEPLP